jgi:hypothetical protein
VNGAAPTHGSKGVVRSKYRVSSKVTYENDGPRNATVEGQWSILGMLGLDNTPNDYGKKAMKVKPNHRTETGGKTQVLNLHSKVSRGEARNGQKAKKTMKEVTENNDHMGNMGANQPSRGAVYDPDEYEFRTTHKELLEENKRGGNIGAHEKRSYVNTEDDAKITMKETTMVGDVVGIASGMERNDGYLVKEVDVAPTHREMTSVEYMTNANRNTHGGYEVTDVQAVGTNRMFSVEYTGNSGNTEGTSNPQSYEDIYNATMKSVRDTQDKGFTPGAQGPSTALDPKSYHATTSRTGDIQNQYLNERGVMASTMTSSIPQMSECNFTSVKETVPNEPIADRINPNILSAFRSNPYSQSLESWA